MIDFAGLKKEFPQLDFKVKRPGVFKALLPFFHEDGDMYDIFVQESPIDHSLIRISDYGLTAMKLSYDFDLDTPNKQSVLESIVSQNRCQINDGDIYLDVTPEQFTGGIYQFTQVISKVSDMNIISKESMKSYFYEFLSDFISDSLEKYHIKKDTHPNGSKDLKVDYEIPCQKPIYIFGVNDNTKASKVVISCLTFMTQKIPFRSLIVHEDIDLLSSFNRNQIINIADKSYTSLDAFKESGIGFIERETA